MDQKEEGRGVKNVEFNQATIIPCGVWVRPLIHRLLMAVHNQAPWLSTQGSGHTLKSPLEMSSPFQLSTLITLKQRVRGCFISFYAVMPVFAHIFLFVWFPQSEKVAKELSTVTVWNLCTGYVALGKTSQCIIIEGSMLRVQARDGRKTKKKMAIGLVCTKFFHFIKLTCSFDTNWHLNALANI